MMKAYAIFDGGGVKGAALAGCLKAAEELKIEFAGYGGTSAGSIVAFLASLGYSGDDCKKIMVDQLDFSDFLDDAGAQLTALKRIAGVVGNGLGLLTPFKLLPYRGTAKRLAKSLGLYDGLPLEKFLREKLLDKCPGLYANSEVTFSDLRKLQHKPLKVVATDLGIGRPRVFSADGEKSSDVPVVQAVRASVSYPFVFQPVRAHRNRLVDGGLSSNLPVFLFDDERKQDHLPVVAFDLVTSAREPTEQYGLNEFCADMLSTALEAGDVLMRQAMDGVYHVTIKIPDTVGTLDFHLSKEQRMQLFDRGHAATHSYFAGSFSALVKAENEVQRLQSLHAPPRVVIPPLQGLAIAIETIGQVGGVRCNIMLPTERGTRIIVYQYGMDDDPDVDLELDLEAGCTGRAWAEKGPMFADLVEAQKTYQSWKMNKAEQNKVKKTQKSMLSVPIFDLAGRPTLVENELPQLAMLGTLAVDSETPLREGLMSDDRQAEVISTMIEWAGVFSRILR